VLWVIFFERPAAKGETEDRHTPFFAGYVRSYFRTTDGYRDVKLPQGVEMVMHATTEAAKECAITPGAWEGLARDREAAQVVAPARPSSTRGSSSKYETRRQKRSRLKAVRPPDSRSIDERDCGNGEAHRAPMLPVRFRAHHINRGRCCVRRTSTEIVARAFEIAHA